MLTVVWVFIAAAWMPVAFIGALGFVPLVALGGVAAFSQPKKVSIPLYMWCILGGLGYAALTSLWSPYNSPLLVANFAEGDFSVKSSVVRLGLLTILGSFAYASAQRLSDESVRLILRVFVSALLLQGLAIAIVLGFPDKIFELVKPFTEDRVSGEMNFLRNVAVFGVSSIFILSLILGAKTHLGDLRFVLAAAFVGLAAYFFYEAGSSIPLISILLAWPCMMFFSRLGKYTYRYMGAGAALLILLSPILSQFVILAFLDPSPEGSFQTRLLIWDEVIRAASQKPVFGWGLDALRTFDQIHLDGAYQGEKIIKLHAHNMMLHIWVETGYIGSLLAAFCVLAVAWRLPAPENLGPYASRATTGLWVVAICVASGSFSVWNDWWWALLVISFVFVNLLYRVWSADVSGDVE